MDKCGYWIVGKIKGSKSNTVYNEWKESKPRKPKKKKKKKERNLKALAINPDIIYEKKLKLEGTQIELIHKYINPLLNIAHVTEFKTKNQKYI